MKYKESKLYSQRGQSSSLTHGIPSVLAIEILGVFVDHHSFVGVVQVHPSTLKIRMDKTHVFRCVRCADYQVVIRCVVGMVIGPIVDSMGRVSNDDAL